MISASLVLYNTKENDLRKVIHCVHHSIINTLFVIDNSPSNVLEAIVKELSNKCEYIHGQGNIGYGGAHNIGIKKSIEKHAEYHIVLNPDIYFKPEVIDQLYTFAQRHYEIGLILPKVTYPNGDLQYLCKLLPTPLDIFGRRLLPKKLIKKRNERFEMRKTGYNTTWNCPILSGCFMFLRTSTLKQVGGFDERFFMYFEDFDLMRRLHRVSQTVYYPHVTIIHNHAAEHHTNKDLLKASIQSAIKYFNKWGWLIDRERTIVNKHAFDEENKILN